MQVDWPSADFWFDVFLHFACDERALWARGMFLALSQDASGSSSLGVIRSRVETTGMRIESISNAGCIAWSVQLSSRPWGG